MRGRHNRVWWSEMSCRSAPWRWLVCLALFSCSDAASTRGTEPEDEPRARPQENTPERSDSEQRNSEHSNSENSHSEQTGGATHHEGTDESERSGTAGAATRCAVPPVPIPRPRACNRGEAYPDCKWQMPHATLAEGRYRRWRNTITEHWWARPALIKAILATADAYHQEYPDQVLAVGDLDAPGPRHVTHKTGVDVDMYLLGAMMVENAGGGRYPDNYDGKSDEAVESLRQRVEGLARQLAICTNGQLRIYYNDNVVRRRFLAWYEEQGFAPTSLGPPMQRHNRLHDFHFHISVPEDLAELPDVANIEHPNAPIVAPPPPSSAPHLSSMNRRPSEWAAVPRDPPPTPE